MMTIEVFCITLQQVMAVNWKNNVSAAEKKFKVAAEFGDLLEHFPADLNTISESVLRL